MSKKFLLDLNGNNDGMFRRWLTDFKGEPRIAWYPSAGEDFRDLLYLSARYSKHKPAAQKEPSSPDIFLHTDYFPWSNSTFLDDRLIHLDEHTKVSVRGIEELPRCDLPVDGRIVDFPQGSTATGRVIFLKIEVQSDVLGKIEVPVVYAFAENAAFCAQRMLPQKARCSHVVYVRFGGGCGGGGKSTGIWLLNVLRKLHCEVFVTDGNYARRAGDERIYDLYPALSGEEDCGQYKQIRTIGSGSWSGHGDISWNVL